MHRFFVPTPAPGSDRVELGDAEARHAVQVLRLGPGDPVELLDGEGSVSEGVIEESGRRAVRVRIGRTRKIDPPPLPVHLHVALLKGRGLDLVLEKSVELGAASLAWIECAHCVARVAPEERPRKRAAWRQTQVEALKQSRNPWLPRLDGPEPLPTGVRVPFDAGALHLLASLGEGTAPICRVLADRSGSGRPLSSIHLWIGPEGDFTETEERLIADAGAVRVSLGPTILRAETAVLAALAVAVNHARG